MTNLLPCPYCGDIPRVVDDTCVTCPNCGAAGPANDPDGARWNAIARAVLSAQPPPAPGEKPFTDAEVQQMACSGWDHTRRLAAEVMEWRRTK